MALCVKFFFFFFFFFKCRLLYGETFYAFRLYLRGDARYDKTHFAETMRSAEIYPTRRLASRSLAPFERFERFFLFFFFQIFENFKNFESAISYNSSRPSIPPKTVTRFVRSVAIYFENLFFFTNFKVQNESLYEIFQNVKILKMPFCSARRSLRSLLVPKCSPSIRSRVISVFAFFFSTFLDAFWRSKMATLWRKISNFGGFPIGRRFSGCKWAFKNWQKFKTVEN